MDAHFHSQMGYIINIAQPVFSQQLNISLSKMLRVEEKNERISSDIFKFIYRLDSDATHTVSVHLGEVLNPEATLYIYLIGQKGETSKVFLKPEEPLEREKTYKFTLALTVDIGKVCQL